MDALTSKNRRFQPIIGMCNFWHNPLSFLRHKCKSNLEGTNATECISKYSIYLYHHSIT